MLAIIFLLFTLIQDCFLVKYDINQLPKDCKGLQYKCVPTYPLSFQHQIKHYQYNIDEFNLWMKNNPFQYGHELRLTFDKQTDKTHIYTDKNHTSNEYYYMFNEFDVMDGNSTREKFFKKHKVDQEIKKIEKKGMPIFSYAENEFIYIFLLHMNLIDSSIFEVNLRLIPSQPNIPLYTLTPYEVNLLDQEIQDNFKKNLESIQQGYDEFTQTLQKNLNRDEMEIFFNKQSISLQDYSYGRFIITRYCNLDNNIDFNLNNKYYLTMFSMFVDQSYENYNIQAGKRFFHIDQYNALNDTDLLKIGAVRNNATYWTSKFYMFTKEVKDEEEILLKIDAAQRDEAQNAIIFLEQGIIPKKNDKNCIMLEILPAQVANQWGLTQYNCFSVHNKKLFMYHAVGNMLNMNTEQLSKCEDIIAQSRQNFKSQTPESEKLNIFNLCAHPKWRFSNIWKKGLLSIEDAKFDYREKISKAEKYLNHKKQQGDLGNSQIILQYLKKQMQTLNDLEKIIQELQQNSYQYTIKEEL